MASEKPWRINRRLLPLKFHYFFFYGGLGGVMPYTPVLAKDLGVNATSVGLIFTIVPFCVFFSKPLFGYLTDYFRNIKLIVFILASIMSLAYMSMLLIPTINHTEWTNVQLLNVESPLCSYVIPLNHRTCPKDGLLEGMNCEVKYRTCHSNASVTLKGWLIVEDSANSNISSALRKNFYINHSNLNNSTFIAVFKPEGNFTCACIRNDSAFLKCSGTSLDSCFAQDDGPVFETFQFWVLTLLAVVSGTAAATVFSLSDAACYEVLGDRPQDYGRQRLWATVSWGITTFVSGLLNDAATNHLGYRTYSPGFYLMLTFVIVDLLLLIKIRLTKAKLSLSICKDIGKVFSSCETIAFAIAVYITGALTGFLWNYEFWYLQDLGATQTLLGLTIAVQCLAAELPFFFFSGWFIGTFGYFYCLTGSFAAFTVRFVCYYFLQNPWWVIPVEVMHGVTFGVFYSAMTGFASSNAPPGTEATTLGILGGLYEGVGVATGSLLGGAGFDGVGTRQTFLYAGIISFICVPVVTIFHITMKQSESKKRPSVTNMDMSQYGQPS